MTTLRDFATALTAGALGYTDGNGPVEVTSSGGDLDDSAYEVVYVLPSGRRVEMTLTSLPPEPFGPVRRNGCSTRSGWYVRSV